MAKAMRVFVVAVALFSATVAAREVPFGEEKTYAPPYGSGTSPLTPATPDAPYLPPSGTSPVVPTTPDTPTVPYTPTAPYSPDPVPTPTTPNSPGTCKWWSSNTGSFPNVISILSTLVDLFGTLSGGSGGGGSSSGIGSIISSIFGSQTTVYEGLTNTRPDGYGALARHSSAALLNSLTRRDYAYSPFQVKVQFQNALGSQQQAFQMAKVFENANLALGGRRP